MERSYRLVLSCPDRVGIVSMVSNFISSHGGSIIDANQHSDPVNRYFFMRVEISAASLPFTLERLREAFTPIANSFDMEWQINDSSEPKRVILMASREAHCLADLLYRYHSNELFCEIPCVISNHEDLRSMVEWHGIPYFCVRKTFFLLHDDPCAELLVRLDETIPAPPLYGSDPRSPTPHSPLPALPSPHSPRLLSPIPTDSHGRPSLCVAPVFPNVCAVSTV